MAKTALPVSKETLYKIGICIGLLLAFILLLILPSVTKEKKLKREILEVQADIKRQEILFPKYIYLQAELKKTPVKELPLPDVKPIGEEDVNKVTAQIEQLATQSRLTVNEVTPDPYSLSQVTGALGVNCEFFGEFQNVHTFLKSLGGVASLIHVETFTVQEGKGGVLCSMRLLLSVVTG